MYRERKRACPACQHPMEERSVPVGPEQNAEIDLCIRCGGIFLEFFDGEPTVLAHGIQALRIDEPPAPLESHNATCPDCKVAMRRAAYHDEELGPLVFRCDVCMAVFANHRQTRGLAQYLPYVFGHGDEEK